MTHSPHGSRVPSAESPRRALVTGAGRGIGLAVSLALARQGWHVTLTGRDEVRLRHAAEQVRALGGQAADVLAGDLNDEGFWRHLEASGLVVQALVHNASQPAPYGRLEALSPSAWQGTLDSVLGAGLRLANWCVPGMKAAGHGRIVFVGSAVSDLGAHGQVAYAAAKSGLRGLVRSLALEVGRHGVTCNLVEPGFIDTERTREAVATPIRAALAARSAVGRAGTPEEVAAVIAFLASPEASYLTGACLPVSGGIELGLGAHTNFKGHDS